MVAATSREADVDFPLLSVLPQAVVVHDAEGRVVAHNANAEMMLGLGAEALSGTAPPPAG